MIGTVTITFSFEFVSGNGWEEIIPKSGKPPALYGHTCEIYEVTFKLLIFGMSAKFSSSCGILC